MKRKTINGIECIECELRGITQSVRACKKRVKMLRQKHLTKFNTETAEFFRHLIDQDKTCSECPEFASLYPVSNTISTQKGTKKDKAYKAREEIKRMTKAEFEKNFELSHWYAYRLAKDLGLEFAPDPAGG